MAIGGKAVTQIYEGERKFQLRLRYEEDYRNDTEAISNLMVPSLRVNKVPTIKTLRHSNPYRTGIIFRDDNELYGEILCTLVVIWEAL